MRNPPFEPELLDLDNQMEDYMAVRRGIHIVGEPELEQEFGANVRKLEEIPKPDSGWSGILVALGVIGFFLWFWVKACS